MQDSSAAAGVAISNAAAAGVAIAHADRFERIRHGRNHAEGYRHALPEM